MSKIARNRKNSMYPRACTLRLLLINIDYRLGHQVTERPLLIKTLYFPITFFEKSQ